MHRSWRCEIILRGAEYLSPSEGSLIPGKFYGEKEFFGVVFVTSQNEILFS